MTAITMKLVCINLSPNWRREKKNNFIKIVNLVSLTFLTITIGCVVLCLYVAQGINKENENLRNKISQKNVQSYALENKKLNVEIEDKKRKIEKKLLNKEEIIGGSNPIVFLNELMFILSEDYSPNFPEKERQLEYANISVNKHWNSNFIWIEEIQEKDGVILLNGYSYTSYDLLEFVKRIKISPIFLDVGTPNFQKEGDYVKWNLTIGDWKDGN